MANEDFKLSRRSLERIGKQLRRTERKGDALKADRGIVNAQGSRVAIIESSSTTTTDGLYPGKQIYLSASPNTYSFMGDGTQDCWIRTTGTITGTSRLIGTLIGEYSDGKPIFQCNWVALLTVQGDDGTPTASGVSRIDVHQDTGLNLTVSGATVELFNEAATTTQWGVVTDVDQTWAGSKCTTAAFCVGAIPGSIATILAGALAGAVTFTGFSTGPAYVVVATDADVGLGHATLNIVGGYNSNGPGTLILDSDQTGGPLNGCQLILKAQNLAGQYARYAVWHANSGLLVGVESSLLGGGTVSGGIVVSSSGGDLGTWS